MAAPPAAAFDALEKLVNGDAILARVRALACALEQSVEASRAHGASASELLSNWAFVGPPGAGKAAVARAFGAVFHGLGLLPSPGVVEVTGADLMADYVGQTARRVSEKMDEARGGVLFIDEAHTLDFSREGAPGFALEAVETLIANITDERYRGNLVIILAGGERDIDALLACNEGLRRRFPQRFVL